ncbi:hypothetical protein [Thermococcus barossii]|uniref:Uncharacterized protein n=1 Tax=Thermococcus barossii TaxID=54077 RepID=A0A2Z2MG74_9EURY|nr:hypothetical protein [Thermococcus barossii]ASJ04906.1 hypothetical protein A3L01_05825 [Thermococcus barossii]
MDKKKKAIILGFVLLLLFYFSPKGLLIPTNAKGISFGDSISGFLPCPQNLQVRAEYYQYRLDHFVNFTLSYDESRRANITLEGVSGEHICIPEGVFVYSYYLGDPAMGINAALFDYNLSLKWWRHFDGFPDQYVQNCLVFVKSDPYGSNSCIYFVEPSTGSIKERYCLGVPKAHISRVQIVDNRVYVTLGYYSVGTFSGETKAFLYLINGNDVKGKEVATIEGHPLGVRLPLDTNGKYVAVAYYLHDDMENEKNGVCVFTAGKLIKIACKEFGEWERPINVKLEGNIVYVQTTRGVKAYKILSLEQSSMQGTDDEV